MLFLGSPASGLSHDIRVYEVGAIPSPLRAREVYTHVRTLCIPKGMHRKHAPPPTPHKLPRRMDTQVHTSTHKHTHSHTKKRKRERESKTRERERGRWRGQTETTGEGTMPCLGGLPLGAVPGTCRVSQEATTHPSGRNP